MDPLVVHDRQRKVSADSHSGLGFYRRVWRIGRVLRFGRIAATSLMACWPLLVTRRPRTPLRILCIGAFEYAARLGGRRLDRAARLGLAYACDYGALRNDYYDQQQLNRCSYRELRLGLRHLAPQPALRGYLKDLRKAERSRPVIGPGGSFEHGRVVAYRDLVLVVSLRWLQGISRRSLEPRMFEAFVALVGLVQLVDDLIDWRDDWACRRPTYVTAFLREWTPTRQAIVHLRSHADRLRGLLVEAAAHRLEVIPLALAGGVVWLIAVALLRIQFSK